MKILLLGPTGQVGSELVGLELNKLLAASAEVVPMDRSKIDFADVDLMRKNIREIKPQLILNAAAYTAVDRAESEPEKAMQVNGIAPGALAEEAKKLGALLVHYSTDYIFDGRKSAPYTEGDVPNPMNVYGKTKLEGERSIDATGCRYLLLRTSWVYAPHGRNFFLTIAKKAQTGEPLRVVSDQHGVPTEARFIAEATVELLKRGAEGLFNVVPSGQTTWHGFATAIVKKLGSKSKVAAIASSEYPTPARRPANSILENKKLSEFLRKTPVHWEELLENCVKAWKAA